MRVLFVSGELIAGDLAYRLKLEECDVNLFIEHPEQQHCLDGFVEKTDDWKKEPRVVTTSIFLMLYRYG